MPDTRWLDAGCRIVRCQIYWLSGFPGLTSQNLAWAIPKASLESGIYLSGIYPPGIYAFGIIKIPTFNHHQLKTIMKRHNFKELLVWQLGMDIVDDVYLVTRGFPKEEKFGLTLQLRKSAVSAPSNIAEGCGRGTNAQLLQYLNIAQGSAFEMETHIYIAIRQNFCERSQLQTLVEKVITFQKMLEGFAERFE